MENYAHPVTLDATGFGIEYRILIFIKSSYSSYINSSNAASAEVARMALRVRFHSKYFG